MSSQRITIKQAAELLGVSQQFLRIGLQQGKFSFGVAVKTSSRYSYFINSALFVKYLQGNLDNIVTHIEQQENII